MVSDYTTSHSTGRQYMRILSVNNTSSVNRPSSVNLPLRKPQLPSPPPVGPIQITPIPAQTTRRSRKKNSNLDIIRLMETLNHSIPLDMYSFFLSECTRNSDSIEALQLHNRLIRHRDLRFDSPVAHRLLYMHVSCGQLDIARNLFDRMPLKKDVLSWAIIIAAYFDGSQHEEGINLFAKMLLQHNVSDVVSEFPKWTIFVLGILKACLHSSNLEFGKQFHCLLLKLGGTNDFSITFSLMDFYGKFGCLEDANSVFNQLRHHDTKIWTVKIVNSFNQGNFNEVIEDFKKMGDTGIRTKSLTLTTVLRACSGMSEYGGNCGKQVHAIAIKSGLDKDAIMRCRLIEMYGKCGMVRDAERVFELNTNKKNSVYWNALLMAYVQSGMHMDAVKFLYLMEASHIKISQTLINRVRIACSEYSGYCS